MLYCWCSAAGPAREAPLGNLLRRTFKHSAAPVFPTQKSLFCHFRDLGLSMKNLARSLVVQFDLISVCTSCSFPQPTVFTPWAKATMRAHTRSLAACLLAGERKFDCMDAVGSDHDLSWCGHYSVLSLNILWIQKYFTWAGKLLNHSILSLVKNDWMLEGWWHDCLATTGSACLLFSLETST